MAFTKHFADYACEGDSITCEVGDFTVTARLYRDDCRDTPDERLDGFWPSLDPKSAGYIGPKSKATLARQTKKAQAVMDAWRKDEWFYCGVAVTVAKAEIDLTEKYSNTLWGVECNYPVKNSNKYLRDVANELIDDALAEAKVKLEQLCDCEEA